MEIKTIKRAIPPTEAINIDLQFAFGRGSMILSPSVDVYITTDSPDITEVLKQQFLAAGNADGSSDAYLRSGPASECKDGKTRYMANVCIRGNLFDTVDMLGLKNVISAEEHKIVREQLRSTYHQLGV